MGHRGGANLRALLQKGSANSILGDPLYSLFLQVLGLSEENVQHDLHPLQDTYVLHPPLAFSGDGRAFIRSWC